MQGPDEVTYLQLSVCVCFNLLLTALDERENHKQQQEFNDDVDEARTEDQDELEEDEDEHAVDHMDNMRNNFIKPLHILQELSGFPNLLMLYSIFCSLAVSSASAERSLSKLKIVKNRLRSSLCDDMLSSLMLIASEKDLMHTIRNEDIINRTANAASSLKAHLIFW